MDTVSRDGQHKVVALWLYDKGSANGAPFVYFSAEARGAEGTREEALIEYACAALDALAWRWGPSHIELKMTTTGPRLVEVRLLRCLVVLVPTRSL